MPRHIIHSSYHTCILRSTLQRRLVLQFSLGTLGHALGKVLLVSFIICAIRKSYLDVVLVKTCHGYTSVLGHVDMSVLAHLLYLLWGHYWLV